LLKRKKINLLRIAPQKKAHFLTKEVHKLYQAYILLELVYLRKVEKKERREKKGRGEERLVVMRHRAAGPQAVLVLGRIRRETGFLSCNTIYAGRKSRFC
jgi:hypothetical protein